MRDRNYNIGCKETLKGGEYWFYIRDALPYNTEECITPNYYAIHELGEYCGLPSLGHKDCPLVKLCVDCAKNPTGALVKAGLIW